MRCIKCGAEIGDARVCSFCDTPRNNVLVADDYVQRFDEKSKNSFQNNQINDFGGTTVLDTEEESGFIHDSGKTPVYEDGIILEKNDETPDSVIPDFVVPERRRWSRKRKIIIIIAASFIGALVVFCCFAFYTYKQYKNYINSLDDSMICFVEQGTVSLDKFYYVDDNDMIKQYVKDSDSFSMENEDMVYSVISSGGRFAAYQINGSYDTIEDDYNSPDGKITVTIETFDLYLIKADNEVVRILHEEKKEGEIILLGVTDQGVIVYNDTEKNKGMTVSNSTYPSEIGEQLSEGLFYGNGTMVLLQQDGQLIVVLNDDSKETVIEASQVSELLYMYGDEKCGYIFSKKQAITSTDSESGIVIYKNNKNEYYAKNIISTFFDSKRIDIDSISVDSLQLYDLNLNVVDLSQGDISGSGKLVVSKEGIIYKHKRYKRNLGKADKILALDGRYMYFIKNGKTIRIDVFSKKERILFDREMQIKRRFK